MKSTEKKAVESKKEGVVYAQGRMWKKSQLEDFRAYQTEYNKNTYRTFVFRVSKEKEGDVINFLESKNNLTEYLKILIREDMLNDSGKK